MLARAISIAVLILAAALTGDTRPRHWLQIEAAFAGRQGTAVMVEAATGRMLAYYHLDEAATRRATPGSAVKPFVLQLALAQRHVDPEQPVICRRRLDIDGRRLNCTHPEAPIALRAREALAYSCNSYFASVATRLDGRALAAHLQEIGFTSRTGWAADEGTGVVREPHTLWERQLLALGVAGVEVTPLELLRAYRALALQRLSGDHGDGAAIVSAGLVSSIEVGMAHPAQSSSIAVAGKTGTASDRGSAATHGFFAGYAPARQPEIVLVVFLDRGRGMDAAAIAGRILDHYFRGAR